MTDVTDVTTEAAQSLLDRWYPLPPDTPDPVESIHYRQNRRAATEDLRAIEAQAVTAYKESLIAEGRTIMGLARVRELTARADGVASWLASPEAEQRLIKAAAHSPLLHNLTTRQILAILAALRGEP